VALPVALVAWEPQLPEEALAVQERLEPLARVEWIHELTPGLANELFPQTVAILVGSWPPHLTASLSLMRRLRLVVGVQDHAAGLPDEELKARGVQVSLAAKERHATGAHDPQRHVERVREGAERLARLLRGLTPRAPS